MCAFTHIVFSPSFLLLPHTHIHTPSHPRHRRSAAGRTESERDSQSEKEKGGNTAPPSSQPHLCTLTTGACQCECVCVCVLTHCTALILPSPHTRIHSLLIGAFFFLLLPLPASTNTLCMSRRKNKEYTRSSTKVQAGGVETSSCGWKAVPCLSVKKANAHRGKITSLHSRWRMEASSIFLSCQPA